jgi:hypothetical protein
MSKTVEQYKKKPVIVEAAQYTEYGKLVKGMCNSVSCFNSGNNTPHVHTIHDNQIVTLEVGDYILPEPDGEHFYPVKPDIFHSTYEPVTTPQAGSDAVASYQARVSDWMIACFGEAITSDIQERCHRFFEEATELVQSLGGTASECHQLVDYVFGRPVGQKEQEVGGVAVTLAALCNASGIDYNKAAGDELARIWTKVEVIREKQAAKPKHSPLPQHPQPAGASVCNHDAAYDTGVGYTYCPMCEQGWRHKAGASVEQAAVIEALQFCKANLVQAREYDRAVIIRELEEMVTAGAAFQCAQGVSELEQLRQWKAEAIKVMPDFQKIGQLIGVKLGESVHDKIIPYLGKMQQPAPAAVSAGTWVKASERFPEPFKVVVCKYTPDSPDPRKDTELHWGFVNKEHMWAGRDWQPHQIEWLDESAGIPAVSELVEALEKISNEFCGLIETDSVKKLKQIAQTALAGFKRKHG